MDLDGFGFHFSTGSTSESAGSFSRRWRAIATLLFYIHGTLGKTPGEKPVSRGRDMGEIVCRVRPQPRAASGI